MLRHAREFNFKITSFHHVPKFLFSNVNNVQALDAWRVPDMLKYASEIGNR